MTIELQLSAAKDEAYEAKRTQTLVADSDFQAHQSHSSIFAKTTQTDFVPVVTDVINSHQFLSTPPELSSPPVFLPTPTMAPHMPAHMLSAPPPVPISPSSLPEYPSPLASVFPPTLSMTPRIQFTPPPVTISPSPPPPPGTESPSTPVKSYAQVASTDTPPAATPVSPPNNHSPSYSHQKPKASTRTTNKSSSYPTRPHVLVLANSHFKTVDARRLVPKAVVTVIPAYTIQEAGIILSNLDFAPDCVILHQITNDVKTASPLACVNLMNEIISKFTNAYPSSKIIISLGLPRLDHIELDSKVEIVNALLKRSIRVANYHRVTFCDHSNFQHNGVTKAHLISDTDGYHLTDDGIRVLCSNIRFKIELVLGISTRRIRLNGYPH